LFIRWDLRPKFFHHAAQSSRNQKLIAALSIRATDPSRIDG
jgi:hypothetical protein